MTKPSALSRLTLSALTAASLAIGALPAAASAAPASLAWGDLDLGTDAGKAELARRIDKVARNACGSEGKVTGTILTSRGANARCIADARSRLEAMVTERNERTGLGG